jgi:hypothetical protein
MMLMGHFFIENKERKRNDYTTGSDNTGFEPHFFRFYIKKEGTRSKF